MGMKPKLEALDYLFENGCDFQITGSIYEEKTGIALPQRKSYLKNGSALAKRAKEKGFSIVKIEEKPIIEKTVYFKLIK